MLAEIETDKANMEMEALGAGVLRKILVPAGGKAPVGALIGVIAEPERGHLGDARWRAARPRQRPAPAAARPLPRRAAEPAAGGRSGAAPPAGGSPLPAAAAPRPLRQRSASRLPQRRRAARPSAPRRRRDGGRVKASPLARSMAAQQNIPLASVPGSGPGGRIIKRDIEALRRVRPPARTAARRRPPRGPRRPSRPITPGQEIPLSSMRKTIARRLSESKFTAPHFYVTVEIDMDAAVALREQLLRGGGASRSPSTTSCVKACAKALTRFPMVNASWSGETIATHGDVHVGVAVAIPDGLITPVVRNADRKSRRSRSRAR